MENSPAPRVAPGTDYRFPAPFRDTVSRRRFLRLSAAGAGAAIAGAAGVATFGPGTRVTASAARKKLTGTIADLRHVVILMQENRSFDHYFGSLRGVRGFADKQVLTYQDGTTVFQQPDGARTDGGYLLPFHMDSAKVDAQNAGELDHEWAGDHAAMNGGAWNDWVAAKTERTMAYFTRSDLPFQYALADAFTVCDGYHQSLLGPTSPNRMYLWAGTSDGWISNPPDYQAQFTTVTSYPELLQAAGVSWQVYTNHENGDAGDDPVLAWVGDYGDNPLWFYQAYQTSMNAADAAGQQLADRGAVVPWQPFQDVPLGPNHVNHVLAGFLADCAAGTLPQVSWIVAPGAYCEHPLWSPSYGAHYVRTVLEALMGNQDLWESTALIINYDEHDGLFDHVVPPAPGPSVTGEFIDGLPIGFGPRVPAVICSPWTRGGYVDSNLHDHTSVLRFLETWTGVRADNVTGWRRTISGDLTTAFDFARPDFSIPDLPDTVPLITQSDAEKNFPPVTTPATGQQQVPAQEPGTRPHRPADHQAHADVSADRDTGQVRATMSVTGANGASLAVYADRILPFTPVQFTLAARTQQQYTWDATQTDGQYAFSIYGSDRFVRSFAGTVVPAEQDAGQVPRVSARPGRDGAGPALTLTLANEGAMPVIYTLRANDFAGTDRTVTVTRKAVTVQWTADADGYYDVVVTADTSDGYTRRYAGRLA